MRAIRIHEHGGPEQIRLEEIPEPALRPGTARVAVRAGALNHLDVWVRRGVPGHRFPLPLVAGSEGSGVIETVAEDVAGWKPGDEVILAPVRSCGVCAACLSGRDPLCRGFEIPGESTDGVFAEKVVLPVRYLIRKPPRLDFAEAAAVPLDFLTAWHMLITRAGLHAGEVVLVHAGGSGVGSAALQIARLWGARTITTVGSARKAEQASDLGAEHVINYRELDFAKEVKRLTEGRGADIVFEHVGADTFDRSMRSLARGGRLVTCGATTGAEVTINLRVVFFKLLSILGSTMGGLGELHEIMGFVDRGALDPVVDRVLPFDRVAEGHRLLEERQAFGKVVIEIQ